MIRTKCWCRTTQSHENSKDEILNYVFAHRKDDEEIFPLTVEEIAVAQKEDKSIQKDKLAYKRKLVENTLCFARMDGLSSLENFNIGQ
jgi:hypothetical protein